jgi:GT2 family glycosyltransferase/glycosyltransferase involved in cell wall biosynthesis
MPAANSQDAIKPPAKAALEGPASAGAAWANGRAAADQGKFEIAKLWLQRAVKLAPADPRIALDLAQARLALRTRPELDLAINELEILERTHHAAAIGLALMSAAHLAGRPHHAAAALARLLTRHCVPADPDFPAAAEMITAAAGLPGWCGVLPSGEVRIGAKPGRPLKAELDGARLTLSGASFQAPEAGSLRITSGGQDLTGSPLDLAIFHRAEGIVSAIDGGLAGWAIRPAAPDSSPHIILRDAAGTEIPIKPGNFLPPDEAAPFARKTSFTVAATKLRGLTPPFHVGTPTQALMGSPIDPAALAAITPVPANFAGLAVTVLPARAALAVIIPVFRDLAATQACLAALTDAIPPDTKIILIDDASPELELSSWAAGLAATGAIMLIRHGQNQGFAAAVNAGLKAAAGHDILLLNSDTLVPPGAVEALLDAAYSAADIGSVTPFSNHATILSVPAPSGNPMPDLAGAAAWQRAAAAANGGQICEIPTGVGFCMLLRHDCLAATGHFRPEIFAQGYGEENDWCLRARHAGYRHVAALGAYVAHQGHASFRGAAPALNARNARILNRLYPGYDRLISDFIIADPLTPARRRLDEARFAHGTRATAVLLISHNHGGGVARIVNAQMQSLRDAGIRPILLIPGAPNDPEATPFPWDTEMTDGAPGDYPTLRFKLPDTGAELVALLRTQNISNAVLHHGLGHHQDIRELAAALGIPQEIVLHDYASFCPRVNLLTRLLPGSPLRYCGEPGLTTCAACVESAGDETFEYLGPAALIARSRAEFTAARRISAPSADAANRIARHFPGFRPAVTPWQDDTSPVTLRPPKSGPRRIAVIGGIGPAKGFDVLIDCANDARRRKLPLEFIIAGASADDEAVLEAGIFITGAYPEGQATGLIKSLNADLAFLPSIWPETWCFALSEAWEAGLYTLVFDLGAQAARLRATGRGAVLPLGLPVPRINDILLAWQPDLREIKAAAPVNPRQTARKVESKVN